jgi:ATP synthase subunit 6
MNYSPLEQFQIYPIFPFIYGILDFSVTNQTLVLLIFFYLLYNSLMLKNSSGFTYIPTEVQSLIYLFYRVVLGLTKCNIGGIKSQHFFPIVFFLFFFLVSMNVSGLIPYSLTITSHIIVTLSLALSLYGGTTIIAVRSFGNRIPLLFLPEGSSLLLGFLIIPIEIISYIFRPLSLAVRLFANIMSGHFLMKVIAGFSYTLIGCSSILFILNYMPLMILFPIYLLETMIAFIQSFVFSLLFCLYINDSINLH